MGRNVLMATSRREFLTSAGRVMVAVPAGWVLLQAGCGGGGDGGAECDDANGVVVTATEITVNSGCADGHVHSFQLTSQQLVSPPASGVSDSTSEADNHVHTVSLTQSEIQQIQAGQKINKITSNVEGHTHVFQFKKTS
jgi:hypothetical protein